MDTMQRNIPLAPYTTFQTGGTARYFVQVQNEDELVKAVARANQEGLSMLVLGGGSNMLVRDAGFPGLVIHMDIARLEITSEKEAVIVTAGAGMMFDDLVAHTVAEGWWGLENLSHIPGSVGATPVQNVGAYGVEVGECISTVRVYDTEENTFCELSAAECGFSYRHSVFKESAGKRYIITAVTFVLSSMPQPHLDYVDLKELCNHSGLTPADVRREVIAIRSQKFPDWHIVGTAGSFFKNPIIDRVHYNRLARKYPELPAYSVSDTQVKVPLGWVLDKVIGARGRRVGNVGCYEGQALVLVNYGGASTHEIVMFAEQLREEVRQATDIEVEFEVTLVGNDR